MGKRKLLETCKKGLLIDSAVSAQHHHIFWGIHFWATSFVQGGIIYPNTHCGFPAKWWRNHLFFVHCWHKWDARGCQLQGKNPPKGRVVYHSTRHHSWTRSEGRTSCWMDRKSWKEGEIFTSTCKFTTVHWWCRIFLWGFAVSQEIPSINCRISPSVPLLESSLQKQMA